MYARANVVGASYVSEGEQRAVKEEHDTKHHEQAAKGGQRHANFWSLSATTRRVLLKLTLRIREPHFSQMMMTLQNRTGRV